MGELKEQQPFQSEAAADLLLALLKEKRSERRWRTFRSLAWLSLILFIIWLTYNSNSAFSTSQISEGNYVAFLKLDGTIEPGSDFSSENVVPALKQAFMDEHAKGLILDINSGGGTPVQSSIIHDAILTLKKKYHKESHCGRRRFSRLRRLLHCSCGRPDLCEP